MVTGLACATTIITSTALAAPSAAALDSNGSAAATVTSSVAEASTADTRFVKLWSAAWMGGVSTYTEEQAVALARRSSVIAAFPGMFGPHVTKMKAANPSLKLLAYKNATFGNDRHPADLYALDSQGRRIAAREWPSTFLMKINDPRWMTSVAQGCDYQVRAGGYDGCFLDVLGSAPLTNTNYLTALPVANGTTWTPNQWISWTTALTRHVRSTYPTMPVSGNGLGEGTRYFDTTQDPRPLVAPLDAAMPELFLRAPAAGVNAYRSESAWLKDVEMVRDVESRGRSVLTMTKLWTTATEAQKRSWHAYSLASFMLATNGTSKFSFLSARTANAPLLEESYNTVEVGTPLADYSKVSGAYLRPFTSGLVVVNPTTAAVTIPLNATYTKLDGTVATGTLTLAPNTGDVLRLG